MWLINFVLSKKTDVKALIAITIRMYNYQPKLRLLRIFAHQLAIFHQNVFECQKLFRVFFLKIKHFNAIKLYKNVANFRLVFTSCATLIFLFYFLYLPQSTPPQTIEAAVDNVIILVF